MCVCYVLLGLQLFLDLKVVNKYLFKKKVTNLGQENVNKLNDNAKHDKRVHGGEVVEVLHDDKGAHHQGVLHFSHAE